MLIINIGSDGFKGTSEDFNTSNVNNQQSAKCECNKRK